VGSSEGDGEWPILLIDHTHGPSEYTVLTRSYETSENNHAKISTIRRLFASLRNSNTRWCPDVQTGGGLGVFIAFRVYQLAAFSLDGIDQRMDDTSQERSTRGCTAVPTGNLRRCVRERWWLIAVYAASKSGI